jgi:carotenoid cleavage dioxygenase-like enzyme
VNKDFEHFFDGLGMLVNFRFEDGKVYWQQRLIESTDYLAWKRTGKPQFQAFSYSPGALKATLMALYDQLGLGVGANVA